MERGYATQVTLFLTHQKLMNCVVILCQYAHFEHSWTKFRNVNRTTVPLAKSRTRSIPTRTLPKLRLLSLPLYTRWKKTLPSVRGVRGDISKRIRKHSPGFISVLQQTAVKCLFTVTLPGGKLQGRDALRSYGETSFKTIRFTAFPPFFETHKLCLCSRLSTSEDKLYFAVNSAAWAPSRGFGWLQHLPAWHSCWGNKQFTSNKLFFGGQGQGLVAAQGINQTLKHTGSLLDIAANNVPR